MQIQHCLAQVRIRLAVSQQIARTAQQFRLFLMLFQPARHFTVGPAVGQNPNRGPVGTAVWRGIGVNGDQHVGALLARYVGTSHHRDEVVTIARQDRFELRIGIQQRLQATSNSDSDILLFQAVRADSARILSAVTGVNGYHHPIAGTCGNAAAARRNFRCGPRNYGCLVAERIRTARCFTHRCWLIRLTHHDWRFTRWLAHGHRRRHRSFTHYVGISATLGGNGKHHGIDTAALPCCHPGLRTLGQVKHQPHALGVFRRTGADTFHQVLTAKIQRQAADLALLVNVQHHAVRAMQWEKGIIRRAVETHRDGGFALGIGDFNIRQRRCGQRTGRTQRPQYGDQGDYE
ncbi:hypothetical protein D3C78_822960 [compost metagenome]